MKQITSLIAAMTLSCTWLMAQNKELAHPFTGYSNTDNLKIERIEFNEDATVVHAVANSAKGSYITISSETALLSNGKRYHITKAPKAKLDKPIRMPDNGSMHLEMAFQPLPADTRLLHFIESSADGSWKICNIRNKEEDLPENLPAGLDDGRLTGNCQLPVSTFCDDSTTISVTILNYVPEAATDLRLTFPMFDLGTIAYNKSYTISREGKAQIKLHPCFPITAYMSMGDSRANSFIIEPGKDMSIMIDMGCGNTRFPAVAFGGNLSNINREINMMEERGGIEYRNDHEYCNALATSSQDIRNMLYDEFTKTEETYNHDGTYSSPTASYLRMVNNYQFALHCYYVSNHINGMVKNAINSQGISPSISQALTFCDFTPGPKYHTEILTSPHMTLCPFFTNVTSFSTKPMKELFTDENDSLLTYNKDIVQLFNTISYSTLNDSATASMLMQTITDTTLRAYLHTATDRWRRTISDMNKEPRIHFSQNMPLTKEDLRHSILNEHQGKAVAFIAFNKKNANSMAAFLKACTLMKQCDSSKIVFANIDMDTEQDDYKAWHELATNHPGLYYMDMRQAYFSLFDIPLFSQDSPLRNGCQYDIYSADGKLILSTSDESAAHKKIREIAISQH